MPQENAFRITLHFVMSVFVTLASNAAVITITPVAIFLLLLYLKLLLLGPLLVYNYLLLPVLLNCQRSVFTDICGHKLNIVIVHIKDLVVFTLIG
jgi:hypothetical protein